MRHLYSIFGLFCFNYLFAQTIEVKGFFVNSYSEPLSNYQIQLQGTTRVTSTNSEGYFSLLLWEDFQQGELLISSPEGTTQIIPIKRSSSTVIDLGQWKIQVAMEDLDLSDSIDWETLHEEDTGLDRGQIGSVLQSQRDRFLNTAAFQFSATFFKLRGLDNSTQEVRLNGISMNSFFRGSPQWSQWGGLNDFTNKGQEFHFGATPFIHGMGGILSQTNIQLRPSQFRDGGKVSQAFSNSSYRYRTQLSYVQTPKEEQIGFGFLVSRRWGEEGYIEGTFYNAWSGAALFEKHWNKKHQTWFTGIYTPNQRGKNAPLTQEVFSLKGRQYNPYWGIQNGKVRNSRVASIQTPMVILNHRWQKNETDYLQLNLSYLWGSQSTSRLGYNGHEIRNGVLSGGAANPDPVYYQYLPSYPLRNEDQQDFGRAYLLEQQLLQDGQLNWDALYRTNLSGSDYALYFLYEDIQKVNRASASIFGTKKISPLFWVRAALDFEQEGATFFAQPTALFGASFLWNYNPYAPSVEAAENNQLSPNEKIGLETPFQYHYGIQTRSLNFSSSIDYAHQGWTSFLGLSMGYRSYLREGYFKNGLYPEASYGNGELQPFLTWGGKVGVSYAITGRHRLELKGQFIQKPPAFKNIFINPREHLFTLPKSTFETNKHLSLSYHWEGIAFTFKTSGYWIHRNNLQEVSYYFADGLGGEEALFVQEITQGIQHQHFGFESVFEYEIVPEFRLAAVVAFGDFRYANNPKLFLGAATKDNSSKLNFVDGIASFGSSLLKNYHLAGGPQRAYSLSMHYEDPSFWRISIFGNYFSNAYLDPNPLLRTRNFYTDGDGLPFANYDIQEATKLLRQEQFPGYFLLNATAGKSWRIGAHFTGFFVSLQNLLNATYITGGYEQGRNANFLNLKEDANRTIPLFSPKYWWGRGSTYFSTFYFRF